MTGSRKNIFQKWRSTSRLTATANFYVEKMLDAAQLAW